MKIILIILGIIFIVIFLIFLECSLILAKREDEYMERYLKYTDKFYLNNMKR